jgi:cobalt-zinc-cadmium efflux system outer membrane protein
MASGFMFIFTAPRSAKLFKVTKAVAQTWRSILSLSPCTLRLAHPAEFYGPALGAQTIWFFRKILEDRLLVWEIHRAGLPNWPIHPSNPELALPTGIAIFRNRTVQEMGIGAGEQLMVIRTIWTPALALPVLLAGCHCFPVEEKIDGAVCAVAAKPTDLEPNVIADQKAYGPRVKAPSPTLPVDYRPADQEPLPEPREDSPKEKQSGDIKSNPGKIPIRLDVPPELLPGGPLAPVEIPLPGQGAAKRKAAFDKLYPALPPLEDEPQPIPGPHGKPLTLADLQRLASANSPLLRQAAANVEAALGAAKQAGLPPNPVIAYEADNVATANTPGFQGGFIEQQFKIPNKLQLARSVAAMDLKNAELAFRKAKTDLSTQVRNGYFAVLVAQESVRLNRSLITFIDNFYQTQVATVRGGGFAAPYEPIYLRALEAQARVNLIQARNRYTSAWKQLAAAMGTPGLPATQLAGSAYLPIPVYNHPEVLAYILSHHTDLATAENTHLQSLFALKLAQVTPIPDVTVHLILQKDYTAPPFNFSPGLQVSMPIPVWDQNQGGIIQAQAKVVNAAEEAGRVRSALTTSLAMAFETYDNNRLILAKYRDEILPDFVRVYRGVFIRYWQASENPGRDTSATPNFGDVIVAEQNLASALASYLNALTQVWQGAVSVADLLQTDDLFRLDNKPIPTERCDGVPNLDQLPLLPGYHPCSPVPNIHQKVLDPEWPNADTGKPIGVGREKSPTRPEAKPGNEKKIPKSDENTLPAPRPVKPTSAPAALEPKKLELLSPGPSTATPSNSGDPTTLQ